jgi:hypothetical protein
MIYIIITKRITDCHKPFIHTTIGNPITTTYIIIIIHV